MKETGFIKQNREKWEEFEKQLAQTNKDPDQLSDLFVHITDDLSYSRTFYSNRSVRVYLNNIAQKVFQSIYKNKSASAKGFWYFWREDLPRAMWQSRWHLLLAFSIFALCMIIGMVSAAYDPDFSRQILSDNYVEQTIENIEAGDPLAIYKDPDRFGMFLHIATNNISIALRMFVSGVLFGLGTLVYTIQNGVMVGAFQWFFIERDLGWESFLTIWMHGAFEISIIVISACAGLVLGGGLVFPGTYSRGQSFLLAARRGVKIMMGVVPLLAFAAFIESYITRYTELPNSLRALLVFGFFGFILFYFVIYPWRKAKAGWQHDELDERLPPTKKREIAFKGLKSFGDMIADMFVVYRKAAKPLLWAGFLCAGLYAYGAYTSLGDSLWNTIDMFALNSNDQWGFIGSFFVAIINVVQYFDFDEAPHFFWYNTGWMTLCFSILFWVVESIRQKKSLGVQGRGKELGRYMLIQVPKVLLLAWYFNGAFWLMGGWAWLWHMFTFNIPVLALYISINQNKWPHQALGHTFKVLPKSFGSSLGALLVSTLLTGLYFAYTCTGSAFVVVSFIHILFGLAVETRELLYPLFIVFAATIGLFMSMPLMLLSQTMLYPSMEEITTAANLKESIARIGKKRKAFGLERLE